jgi:hypothetical protein
MQQICPYTFFLYWKKEVEILNQVTIIGWKQRDSAAFLFWGLFDSPPFALTCTILSNVVPKIATHCFSA